jgi:hypothetical protein
VCTTGKASGILVVQRLAGPTSLLIVRRALEYFKVYQKLRGLLFYWS